MRRTLITGTVAVAAGLAGAASALGGQPGTRAPAAKATASTTIGMGEYYYRPARVTVRAGSRVTFVNRGRIDHTVADTDRRGDIRGRVIRPRQLGRGDRQTVTLRRVGTIYYRCTLHPSLMKGVIKVVR